MKKIAFIGAGNMAFAIASGIISSGITDSSNILLFDTVEKQYSKFDPACQITNSISELSSAADYIFLSVKPQNIKTILEPLSNSDLTDKVIISICAGITISTIESFLKNAKICRAMPNTPLLIGQGVTAVCHNENVTKEEQEFVAKIFSSAGFAISVNEEDINNITAISGSAPAYVYLFIKNMCDAAVKLGFNSEKTKELICKTFIGASNMILSTDKTLDELISMVKSPNGTTERALNVFENQNLEGIIFEAMDACAKRAEELSKID